MPQCAQSRVLSAYNHYLSNCIPKLHPRLFLCPARLCRVVILLFSLAPSTHPQSHILLFCGRHRTLPVSTSRSQIVGAEQSCLGDKHICPPPQRSEAERVSILRLPSASTLQSASIRLIKKPSSALFYST